jgi:hypothetical protein
MKLLVIVEKTKMMVFNKKKRKIQQVNEFKYLGYTFNERATDKAHIREIVRKANKISDFRRRMMMFDNLIESILMYRAEIWRWKEQEEVEKKYLRGVLGVNRETP